MSRGYAEFTFLNGLAPYKAWGTAVQGAITAALGPRTSDTGQVNFASVATEPTTTRDYEIYKLGGAIQSTAPLFVRVDYVGGAVSPRGVNISTGTGTDGAGNLTGITTPQVLSHTSNYFRTGITVACYTSSDRDSFFNLIFSGDPTGTSYTGGANVPFISVERTRDLAGNSTGDGWIVCLFTSAGSSLTRWAGAWSRSYTAASQPPAIDFTVPTMVPNTEWLTSALISDTAYAFPTYPYSYLTIGGASKAILVCFPSDFPRFSEVTITHYGTPMKFIGFGDSMTHNIPRMTSATAAVVKPMAVLARWE